MLSLRTSCLNLNNWNPSFRLTILIFGLLCPRISGAQSDTTPPDLTSLSVSPTSVNVSSAPATVTVNIGAHDAGSGVASASVLLISPSSNQQATCVSTAPSSGTTMNGVFSCTLTINKSAEPGVWVSSQIVLFDVTGNFSVSGSSAFSASVTVTSIGADTAASVSPSSGSGASQTFALQYADPLGATDLSSVWVWITASFGPLSNTCLLEYATAANQLYLYNDAGTGWLSPATVGAAGTLGNSQCSINTAASSVTKSGTNLTLNLPMTFTAAYAGAKTTFMYAGGSIANSGWQTMGTWTVPAASGPPSTVSVAPSSGSGLQQTFALQYADPLGATDLSSVWVWITASFGPLSNTCLLEYATAANQLYLYNDAGTGWLSPATVGAAGTLNNSQCSINMVSASVTKSGTNLTLNLPVTFTGAYAGAKNTYMYAAGSSAGSGWQMMGSWSVP
jgi:trimeric autotransporter adhesin